MNKFALRILNAKSEKTHLFSVGQAGYILKSRKGQLLGIDLYLSECVERIEGNMGFKRLLPGILEPLDLILNFIVVTHSHYDHFDMDVIPKLVSNNTTQLYASMGCKNEIKKLKMSNDRITYVRPGDQFENGDYALEFISCDHGMAAPDAVGVIITVDEKKICITGDTCLHIDWLQEYTGKGTPDILIGPINGAYGNMSEQDFAELSSALRPRLTIPCHYGMFAAHGGDPGLFIKAMHEKCPSNNYYLMALGEGIII